MNRHFILFVAVLSLTLQTYTYGEINTWPISRNWILLNNAITIGFGIVNLLISVMLYVAMGELGLHF